MRATFTITATGQNAEGGGTVNLRAVAKGAYQTWTDSLPQGVLGIGNLNAEQSAWFAARIGQDVAIVVEEATADDTYTAPEPEVLQPGDPYPPDYHLDPLP